MKTRTTRKLALLVLNKVDFFVLPATYSIPVNYPRWEVIMQCNIGRGSNCHCMQVRHINRSKNFAGKLEDQVALHALQTGKEYRDPYLVSD